MHGHPQKLLGSPAISPEDLLLHSCSSSPTSHSPPHGGKHEPPIPPHARSPLECLRSAGANASLDLLTPLAVWSWPLGAVIMVSVAAMADQLKIINEEIIAL